MVRSLSVLSSFKNMTLELFIFLENLERTMFNPKE